MTAKEKSKHIKRSIVVEDSDHLEEKQKRCKLKCNRRSQNENFNDESCDKIVAMLTLPLLHKLGLNLDTL